LIEAWLDKFLLPQVQPGQVIVMDNAPFHNSRKIRQLIEKAGCELLFLPTYSSARRSIYISTETKNGEKPY
jgi:transposase